MKDTGDLSEPTAEDIQLVQEALTPSMSLRESARARGRAAMLAVFDETRGESAGRGPAAPTSLGVHTARVDVGSPAVLADVERITPGRAEDAARQVRGILAERRARLAVRDAGA